MISEVIIRNLKYILLSNIKKFKKLDIFYK